MARCRSVVFSLVFSLALFGPRAAARADTQVHKAPNESWVEVAGIPELDPARTVEIRNGTAYLLMDTQTRHRSNGFSMSQRMVYRVTDRSGLENAARLSFDFDPTRERLIVNRVTIIRNNVHIDKLGEARFEVFRQETDAERGVFDGRLTAHAELSDVRVGDIVDYSTTRETTPTVAKDLFFSRFYTEWSDPIGYVREKIIWPANEPLYIRAVETDMKPGVTTAGGETTYLWEATNLSPTRSQTNLPADVPNFGFVEVSSERDWQSIADALLPSYQPSQDLPADFEAKLVEIERRHSAPEDRLIATLRLIQDEIRYVSLSIGSGSYLPRRPETVLASGFGDCKDKALLLVSALRRLSIDAEVALTDIDEGYALNLNLPALQAFDHAIVKAKIGERVWWLDPTDYLQGGRAANIVPPTYGFALPLLSSGTVLEPLPKMQLAEPTKSMEERFAFPAQDGEPLVLTVETIYRDADADTIRRKLAYTSKTKLTDDYVQYYNQRYPGIESTALLEAVDDRDQNVLKTREAYKLPFEALHANDLAKKFPLRSDLGIGGMPTPTSVGRTGPIFLGLPTYNTHKVIVTNLKARFDPPVDPDVFNPHFLLKLNVSSVPGEMQLQWHFRTVAERVAIKAVAPYLRAIEDSIDKSEWQYDFTYAYTAEAGGNGQ